MADNAQWINVDNLQVRIMNSFVNLTKSNPTQYPALTTTKYEYNDTALGGSNVPVLTAYYIYDQYAIRVASLSGLQFASANVLGS